jgi:pentatricopeptide repeat protein
MLQRLAWRQVIPFRPRHLIASFVGANPLRTSPPFVPLAQPLQQRLFCSSKHKDPSAEQQMQKLVRIRAPLPQSLKLLQDAPIDASPQLYSLMLKHCALCQQQLHKARNQPIRGGSTGLQPDEAAMQVHELMVQRMCSINEYTYSQILRIFALSKPPRIKEAMDLVSIMRNKGGRYVKLFSGRTYADLLFSIHFADMAPRLVSATALIRACGRNSTRRSGVGGYDANWHVMQAQSLFEVACEAKDVDVYLFNAAIFTFIQAGDLPLAMRTFRRMDSLGVKPDNAAFNMLITGWGKAKQPVKSAEVFDRMLASEWVKPDLEGYSRVLTSLTRVKDLPTSTVKRQMQAGGTLQHPRTP